MEKEETTKEDNKGKQGYCYNCGSDNLYFKNSLGEVIIKEKFDNLLVFKYLGGDCNKTGQDVFALIFRRNVIFPDK